MFTNSVSKRRACTQSFYIDVFFWYELHIAIKIFVPTMISHAHCMLVKIFVNVMRCHLFEGWKTLHWFKYIELEIKIMPCSSLNLGHASLSSASLSLHLVKLIPIQKKGEKDQKSRMRSRRTRLTFVLKKKQRNLLGEGEFHWGLTGGHIWPNGKIDVTNYQFHSIFNHSPIHCWSNNHWSRIDHKLMLTFNYCTIIVIMYRTTVCL